jgi:cysteine-rich repeat protein
VAQPTGKNADPRHNGAVRALRRTVPTISLLIGLCAPATAHQGAVPLTFWADNFGPTEARCQLEIGAGAATCGFGAWTIRRDCLFERLEGRTCDEEADDDAIEALRLAVFRGDIDPACQGANLQAMAFQDLVDVQLDVVTFCRELEAAAVSVVFNPFFAADRADDLDDAQKACIRTFAGVATKAFNYAFRVRRSALDRIANRRRSSRVKNADLDEADLRVEAANQALREALLRGCSEETFVALYGQPTEQAVELVASRSACLATRTYPVQAYECPAAVCGNGMRETNERCDDGNTDSGDGCSATCENEL